jgi:hypothetical protein
MRVTMVCVQVSMYEKIVLCVMLAIGGSYGIADGAFRLWLETGGHYQRDRSESRGRAERRWRPAREGAAQSTRRTPSRDRGVPPGAVRDERGAGSSGDPQGFSRSGGEADKHGPPITCSYCVLMLASRRPLCFSCPSPTCCPILGTPVFPRSWGTARRGSVRSISSGQAMAPLLATRPSSALRTPCGTISVRKTSSPTASSPIIARGEYDPRVSRQ